MNDIAKVARTGRTQVVTLPESVASLADEMRVRVEGRRLVLEPLDMEGVGRIPPGYYTPETLPPLSEGARKILESVDAAVAKFGAAKAAHGPITLDDEPYAPIELSDEGLPGIELDD